jgi:hypothetical protein
VRRSWVEKENHNKQGRSSVEQHLHTDCYSSSTFATSAYTLTPSLTG